MGFWDGKADRTPHQNGRQSWAALKAMSNGPRRAVLDQALLGMCAVSLDTSTDANDEGRVTLDGETIVTLKKPTNAFLADKQLRFLRTYADLRGDRLSEIVMQTGDIQSFFALVGYMAPDATKWTLALNQAIYRLCTMIEQPLKHAFDVARPIAMTAKVQPIIQTPGHGSWPSGHATESFASATLLTRLFYNRGFDPVQEIANGNELYRHAERIAMNRTVAGVHFPTDSMAGAVLGVTLAEALVRLLDGETEVKARTFNGDTYEGDFTLKALTDALDGNTVVQTTSVTFSQDIVPAWLRRLWDDAKEEW
ncbi:phosphatase PAP2 family protein [Sagittula stellata]|uniref:phosphatase PAP2 family protein n=1 Tax=Sagittula stellata TaxID=52603 RepID=UPI001E6176AA|nr:phosphatase PAP2 family protein [Sagittula stellata]